MARSGTEVLRCILREKMREAEDKFTFTHSNRISFFNNPGEEMKYQSRILATEVVVVHRKLDILEILVKAGR